MLNLLPTEEKKEVKREYHRRIWSVALSFSLFTLICGTLLLLPSLLKVDLGINQAESSFEVLSKKPAVSDYEGLKKTITDTKTEVAYLNDEMTSHIHLADLIGKALENKPSGIKVSSVTWLVDDNNGKELILYGSASNRDTLNRYDNLLQSNTAFSNVTLPISDFAKSSGADFSITINISDATQ